MYYGPGSKRKLPLESYNDWVYLSSLLKKAKGKIPIYMVHIRELTEHHVIEHELESRQVV